jgi:hypothetical protein
MAYRPQTLAEAFRDLNAGVVAPYIAFGNFLDDFYATQTTEERERLLAVEPEPAKSSEARRWACLFAGLADWISFKYEFATPDWALQDSYRLSEPWFILDNWRLRPVLLFETPPPFVVRNIFCGDRMLMRV